MSYIKLKSLKIRNYRSFGNIEQEFDFTRATDKKLPLAIVGYNNVGKTNLMNAIRYGIGDIYVQEMTFEKKDLHNLNYENNLKIESVLDGSYFNSTDWKGADCQKSISGTYNCITRYTDEELKSEIKPSFFGMNKHYQIFYINFHKIKEEISTQKTSWGNLKSFLAKHIKKLVEEEESTEEYQDKKTIFKLVNKISVQDILENTKLSQFVTRIKNNYSTNLRDNNCEVEFGLPDYEDIFLQMVFKIGLNGKIDKLVPIDHFGDGYISMFVMAVIQAIAEEKTEDNCLFLFEEPESFLHENHQEYFYKRVLCELAEKGHQVIYTTHSDKMVDITKPDSLIRLKFDGEQTVKTFPQENSGSNPVDKNKTITLDDESIPISDYNSYIKNIEPNLNKILYSEKVILVEGPNDLLVYNHLIQLKAREIAEKVSTIKNKEKWADAYLNFNNIAIIPHHGKATAYILANLCQYLGVDYYLINDWDFEKGELDLDKIASFQTENELKQGSIYTSQTDKKKGMITTNWKLIKSAKDSQIHFNIKKLEEIIEYNSNDKNPVKIWQAIKSKFPSSKEIQENVFPETLDKFLFPQKAQQYGVFQKALPKIEIPTSTQDFDIGIDIDIDIDSINIPMPF